MIRTLSRPLREMFTDSTGRIWVYVGSGWTSFRDDYHFQAQSDKGRLWHTNAEANEAKHIKRRQEIAVMVAEKVTTADQMQPPVVSQPQPQEDRKS